MPPKVKVTKEMILDAAFEIARREGIEQVSARTVSQALSCSTQPVMYNFATIEDMRRAVYEKADAFHGKYIMDLRGSYENPMMEIGVSYVRFAAREPHLFQLLFQSGHFSHQSITELVENEALSPVLETLARTMHTDQEHAKQYFFARFLMVHGMASLLANNSMVYDEELVMELLQQAFYGEGEAL